MGSRHAILSRHLNSHKQATSMARPRALPLLLLAALAIASCTVSALTVDQYKKVRDGLVKLINENQKPNPAGKLRSPLHATLLRLAFHDCTGDNGCAGIAVLILAARPAIVAC
jgi:hypothetical protein